MEHLLHVKGGCLASVPLYADIDDLCGTRANASWDVARLQSHGDLQNHSVEETARFFQSRLYFEFLDRFFRTVPGFKLGDFITSNERGNQVVTTVKLQNWLIEWFTHIANSHTVQYVQRTLYESLESIFGDVYNLASLFCSVGRSSPYHGPVYQGVPEDLSLSILVLFAALEKAATQVTGRRFNYDLGNSRLLVRLLHERYWCPTDVEWLSLRNIDTMYTACTMERPYPRVRHDARCQPWKCEAFQVEDETTYKQEHVSGCNGCGSREVPIQRLKLLIGSDQIPLVSFEESGARLLVEGIPKTSQGHRCETCFIALSHVWSDGLGNPNANSLPVCQLRRLQRLMNEVSDTSLGSEARVLWWCDTLCVPARGLADESRKRAIQDMKHVYLMAYKMLVLDQFLTSCKRNITAIEAYLCLLISRWMRRLWTFHEAVLAQNTLIQFADGSASLSSLYQTMQESKAPILLYSWYDNDCIEALKPFVEGMGMEQSFLTAIYRAVAVRGTSRQSDETICLANVQGVDVKSLLDIEEEDCDGRMAEYFVLVRKLPAILLFQRLPRLPQKGFRWAPRSLLARFRQSPTSLIYSDFPDMAVGDARNGVSVQLPGVFIDPGERHLAPGHHFGLVLTREAETKSRYIVYYAPGEGFDEKEYENEVSQLSSPGLILWYPPWSDKFETFDRAALVQVTRDRKQRPLIVEYVALVGLRQVPESVFNAQYRKFSRFSVCQGTFLSESTHWLVS